MKKYDNIIFDVGDVLLEYRWKQMLMDCGLSEEEAIRVGHELFDDNDDLWHIFDLAIMSDEEILNTYCKKYPDDAEIITFLCITANLCTRRDMIFGKRYIGLRRQDIIFIFCQIIQKAFLKSIQNMLIL